MLAIDLTVHQFISKTQFDRFGPELGSASKEKAMECFILQRSFPLLHFLDISYLKTKSELSEKTFLKLLTVLRPGISELKRMNAFQKT